MDAGLLIIAGAAGLIGVKVLTDNKPDPNQPNKAPTGSYWNSWFEQGNQPATGNGGPTTDNTGRDIANTIQAVSKFGTSLFQFFGTSQDNQSSGGGTSTGGPTNSYGGGKLGHDGDDF
jgi:hypothetical protein